MYGRRRRYHKHRPRWKRKSYRRKMRRFFKRRHHYPAAGVPNKKTVLLKYSELLGFGDFDTYPMATCTYSANGIHQVNIDNPGHQPMGHDIWSPLYNHYRVLKSKILVKWMPGVGAAYGYEVGIKRDSDGYVDVVDPGSIIEQETGTIRTIDGNIQTSAGAITKFGWKPSTYFRSDKANLNAQVGYNPSEQDFFHVFARPLSVNPLTNALPIIARIIIKYLVQYFDPKEQFMN